MQLSATPCPGLRLLLLGIGAKVAFAGLQQSGTTQPRPDLYTISGEPVPGISYDGEKKWMLRPDWHHAAPRALPPNLCLDQPDLSTISEIPVLRFPMPQKKRKNDGSLLACSCVVLQVAAGAYLKWSLVKNIVWTEKLFTL